jgi:hypothetical protein
MIGADVRPDWTQRPRSESLTGTQWMPGEHFLDRRLARTDSGFAMSVMAITNRPPPLRPAASADVKPTPRAVIEDQPKLICLKMRKHKSYRRLQHKFVLRWRSMFGNGAGPPLSHLPPGL